MFLRFFSTTKFTADELKDLPEKHKAHNNPDLTIERNVINVIELPILNKISNKVEVIFNNEETNLLTTSK